MYQLKLAIAILALLLPTFDFVRPGLADVPRMESVDVWNNGGKTLLNITIYHNQEIATHLVDSITVTVSDDVRTFPQSSPHTLDAATRTFNITIDLGVISGTPSTTVQAHCNLHGSSLQNWTGIVFEYSLFAIILTLALISPSIIMAIRRSRVGESRRS